MKANTFTMITPQFSSSNQLNRNSALRLELLPFGVYVTTVNPGPIKTSFFDQADPDGSYVKAVDKYILEPDFVASKIVSSFGKKKREMNLPTQIGRASCRERV